MAKQKWFLVAVTLPVLMLCGFTFRFKARAASVGHAEEEQAIRQLNEDVLHAHDIADAATLDRIEDADFTISGDFGVTSKQEQLEGVRKRTGKAEVISRKIDPQVFRFYEDVALVTETDRSTTKDGRSPFNQRRSGCIARAHGSLSICTIRAWMRSSKCSFFECILRVWHGGKSCLQRSLDWRPCLSASVDIS